MLTFWVIDYNDPVCSTTQSKHVKTRALHSHPKFKTWTHCEAVNDQSKMCEFPL